MTLEEAVKLRHAVRQYLPTDLSQEQVDALHAKTAEWLTTENSPV